MNKPPVKQRSGNCKDRLPEVAEEVLGDNIKRDISSVLSIDTLKALSPRQLDMISFKLAGYNNTQIADKLGVKLRRMNDLLNDEVVQGAISEATWNLKAGILSASDVAQASEGEVLLGMYAMFKDEDLPLEWRFKCGSKVLDHRLNIAKAVGNLMPREALPSGKQVQVIEIESSLKDRMTARLKDIESIPIPDLAEVI